MCKGGVNMSNVINKNMKIGEIRQILKDNGIETPYGWQIMLMLLFNTYNADTAEIVGYGRNAEFKFTDNQQTSVLPLNSN